jgi:capsular exopolysaccharide synthesis family protein
VDLQHVLSALRRAWYIPALTILLAGGAALAVSLLVPPTYTAQTKLFVSTSSSATTSDVVQSSAFSEQRAASYAEMIMGPDLAARLITALDLETTPEVLVRRIAAEAVPGTVLVDVSVEDASPQQAQRIAQAIGEEFPRVVNSLETAVGGAAARTAISVVEPAVLPGEPTSPNVLVNVLAACLAGLLIGVVVVIARARLDRTVKDVEQAETITGAPVIGVVSHDPLPSSGRGARPSGASGDATGRGSSEDVRKLRTKLQFVGARERPTTIMVTSALDGEGRTTLAIDLAMAMAETNSKVLLLEADLREPTVGRHLGLAGQVGLSEVLSAGAAVEDAVQAPAAGRISVITAGTAPTDPGTSFASECMSDLVAKLREEYDIVVVDAPALLPVADATVLAPLMDAVLLVTRHGRTGRDQLAQATTELENVGIRLSGVVLNDVPPRAQVARVREHRRVPRSAVRVGLDARPSARIASFTARNGGPEGDAGNGHPAAGQPSRTEDASDHLGRRQLGDTADRS